MTAQILATELGTLIQDSKRKNAELKNAAEKSLQDLKSLSLTSEAQLSADLSRRPHFISPFLIACHSRNSKFSPTGVSCLQRLTISRALPKDRLTEVLDALKECVPSSHDVQLKILQSLPSLAQNYAAEIRGELLSNLLQICSTLQTAKNFAVSNTAAATLQQLVISVFDRVASEDERALQIPTIAEVQGDDATISVRPAAHDAYKVFNDLSLLITGEKPVFIRFSSIPSTATLEVIEAVLSNHSEVMTTHLEQIHLVRSLLMPTIIRSLSDRLSFPITLRIIRILNLIIRKHLNILPSECEIALGLLNHMLDPEAANQWKRALCLEVFRGIYSDPRLLLQIFSLYDVQDGKKNIFGDNLASFVRLSTEKPMLIGLGQQSTLPANRDRGKDDASDHAVAEADALAGVIGGPSIDTNSNGHVAGISAQWSTLKVACIEHLDKSEPPNIPETYVYSLVLTCITNVTESLAKFVLPLTVHHDNKNRKKNKLDETIKPGSEPNPSPVNVRQLSRTQSFRKKTIPINPLDLEEHSSYLYIKTSAALVVECWPAVLATCSTFLNAALDTDYYRALVRAIQKFTQVAGLLRLITPRDAFLTTLGKAVAPSNLLVASVSSPRSPANEHAGVKELLSSDSILNQASPTAEKNQRPSRENSLPTLGPRNLLCLRALLNLAIALGPTLGSAWSIIFETLQIADFVMAMSSQTATRTPSSSVVHTEPEASTAKVETETSAVQAAARRLFESTVDFPNESFVEVLQALCNLIHHDNIAANGGHTPAHGGRPKALHQRRLGSVSGISLGTGMYSRDFAFALNKIGELAALNEERLAQYDPSDSGWNILTTELVHYSADNRMPTQTRLFSADILSRTVKDIAGLSASLEERDDAQARILSALQIQISELHQSTAKSKGSYSDTDIRVHQVTLEALKSVIEQCGESLIAGWASVFDCLLSVFSMSTSHSDEREVPSVLKNTGLSHDYELARVVSKSLARTAFDTVQFVCSDFLGSVPNTSLANLLELLLRFSCQQDDLNMSLTAVTFFWNVSDFLHVRSDLANLQDTIGDVRHLENIREVVLSKSREGNISALWLQVSLDLSLVTTDKRAELRNTAIQTIQRIFENYIDQLSSTSWMLCLRTVLFNMVELNLALQNSIRRLKPTSPSEDFLALNDTSKNILSSISSLFSTYMDKFDDTPISGEAWSSLLDYFRQYLLCGSHALGCAVFTAITRVLSHMSDAGPLGTAPILKTAAIWRAYFDGQDAWQNGREKNQEAFVAYAHAFNDIYRLAGQALETKDVRHMLSNLETCVVDSDEVPYSSDVDSMTDLQQLVIECFGAVRSSRPGLPGFLIRTLSRMIVLPYSTHRDVTKRGPTFVALSKAAMGMVEVIVSKHVADDNVYTDGAFLSALTSLSKPIHEKYVWHMEGKSPTLWQKATSTTLAILEYSLEQIDKRETEDSQRVWEQIIIIANGIIRARVTPMLSFSSLQKDESFDREAFGKLRDLITPSLGSPRLPDELRRTYTRHLFETSIIHEPAAGEIPDLVNSPLEDVYKIRLGRTDDGAPRPRTEMAYMCMSELFSLTWAQAGCSKRVKLAQAAAPYVILRVALVLRAYIADQGLRGGMPQPESQRRELLFVLQEMGRLKSEPAAIPDAAGVKSKHRRHLHRIYPLVVRALRVARKDGPVFEALVGLTDMVGMEFGVSAE